MRSCQRSAHRYREDVGRGWERRCGGSLCALLVGERGAAAEFGVSAVGAWSVVRRNRGGGRGRGTAVRADDGALLNCPGLEKARYGRRDVSKETAGGGQYPMGVGSL